MSDDWYKRDVRAAIKGMVHLTLEERGAYNTIIDHQYLMNGPLPDDSTYMAGILGCDARVWKRIRQQLLDKGRLELTSDGRIADLRASYELARRQHQRSKRVAAGQLGGIASGEARKANGLREAHASTTSNQIREDKIREETLPNGSVKRAREGEKEFREQFWPLYPHKVGKGAALIAFQKARRKTSLEEILQGLQRYIASKPPDREWCNPATWLNQERWSDEPAAVSTGPPKTKTKHELELEQNEEFLRNFKQRMGQQDDDASKVH